MLEKIDLDEVVAIAKKAGDAIMEIYKKDFHVAYKDDKSPLTEADTKSNDIICNALAKVYPEIPMLSEENQEIAYEDRKDWEYYWCIDPIDGTKEFIKKNGEFTINIALIHKETPVLGVVYAPALGEIYWAKRGDGAWKAPVDGQWSIVESKKERLPITSKNEKRKMKNELIVVASKSHLNDYTKQFIESLAKSPKFRSLNTELISKGSSLKLLMVAEGSADIYPRLAPTMEWDTAAADAIVREAGKMAYRY
ncbi:MAG: 3'(2'),5'-bisphosphate nucleotidase CysQ, partial [Sulfurovum sp.]|nr:3'(2'),5'-bisphosphate nucleotidase CysQ [Sulfurovum sp.]